MSAPREYRPATTGTRQSRLMAASAERLAKTPAQLADEKLDKAAHDLALREWMAKQPRR